MGLNIFVDVLTFILALLGAILITSKLYKTIIIIIGVAILISNYYIKKKAKKEKEEDDFKFEALDYEAQRSRLSTRGMPEHYISGLGKDPFFKQAYQSGQEYEKKRNYKDAIKSYKEILKYSRVDEKNKVAAYNLIGLSYFELYKFEEAMKYFQMALSIINKVKVKEERLKGKAVILDNIGRINQELGQWKNAIKNYKSALGIHIKLNNKLEKANSFNSIYITYLYLNKTKKALKKAKEAIKAYKEALKASPLDNLPIKYAMIQNNFGVAYNNLAKVENMCLNCNLSIQAHKEALKVRRAC